MKLAIVNGKICTPECIKHGFDLIIENGKIINIRKSDGKTKIPADKIIDAKNNYVLPGFFDIHCHGAGLYDACCGKYDYKKGIFSSKDEDYEQGIPEILKKHVLHGTTSMILSSFATSQENIKRFLGYGGYYTKHNPDNGSRLLGLDIEGIFLKNPAYAGAQNPDYFIKPEIRYFDRIMKLSGNAVKKILVAPEWGKDALKFIRHITKNGIVAGVGHSGATYEELIKAYQAGVKVIVHCGNGPMSQNFKDGGVIDALFYLRDKVTAELICDYHHVNPRWMVTFIKNFNFNIIGITDAMFVVESPVKIKKEFKVGDKIGIIDKDVLMLKGVKNILFGSLLTMDKAFQNFVNLFVKNTWGYLVGNLFEKPIGIDKAVIETSKILSLNPAKLFKLDKLIGSIEKGKCADVLIMEISKKGNGYGCKLKSIILNGRKLI